MADPAWKHIGLHGMAVGTFTCTDDAVVWKSAESVTRKIAADQLSSAAWTVFGKMGSLRLSSEVPVSYTHLTLPTTPYV